MPSTLRLPGVFVEEVPGGVRAIDGVSTSITAFVGRASCGPVEEPTSVASWGEYETAFGGLEENNRMGFSVRDFFRNGGRDALIVRIPDGGTAQQITAGSALRSEKRGLYSLEKADLFNLLSIPPYLASGDVEQEVLADAAAYCEERRAILLVDPPSDWTTKDAVLGHGPSGGLAALSTHSENATLYFPRLRQANPLRNGVIETFVPSGAVAGVIARTDLRRGVWKAPAGLEAGLVGAPELSIPLTDADNGELNTRGVNCLRVFPHTGPVVWGARTLQGDNRLASEWKYLPVRRLALFLEESIDRGTRWAVFEPNNSDLWSRLRATVEAFLDGLFRRGAFQGASRREAYFVKCDHETTTQVDLGKGRVNLVMGFAPLKPAEFVILQIGQKAQPAP